MIVTVTPTVMSGTVVRWYRGEASADRDTEMVSVSREGIHVACYLHEVPDDVMAAAKAAHEALIRNREADLSHLATHRRRGLRGPLEPVVRVGEVDPSLVLILSDELRRSAEAGEPSDTAAERVLALLTAHGRVLNPSSDVNDVCGAIARMVRATVVGSPQEAVARAAYRAALAEAQP